MNIYRKINGVETEVCVVSGKGALLKTAIMGIDEVQISVVVDVMLDIKEGDYIIQNGINYTLNRDAEFTKVSDVQYNYELIFEHPIYTLLDKLFVHKVSGLSNFILTGKLRDFVELLVWCVNISSENHLGVDAGWSVGSVVETEFRNIVFTDLSCREVLNVLANEFNAEYYLNNKQINFVDRIENATGLVFEQGAGKGLYSIAQRNVDKADTVTRIYPRGGNKNVPNEYADYEGYLVLPERYIENLTEHSKVVEKKVTFEDEFPHFLGKVSSVSGTDNTIFTCPEIDFDVAQFAVGDNARINFLSGDLMGVSFKFQWNNALKQITLIKQDDETALPDSSGVKPQIPNASKKANNGNDFNFTGLFMPVTYVEASQTRLRTKAQSYLDFYSRKRVKFDLVVDHRFMRGKPELKVGDLVTINIPQKNMSKLIRITTLDKNLDTGAISCTVSNYLDEKWEKKIENQISNLSSSINSGAQNAVEKLVDIIQQYDSRVPSDRNILSSLRTLLEIKNRAISKTEADTASGLIKFIQGLEVGNFTKGLLGGGGAFKMINGVSELEVDKLTVRMIATFFELVISKLSHIGGQLVLTPARMKIKSVEDGGSYYKCYFDRGENNEVDNDFTAGDQARCQVFSGSGQKFYWRLVTSVGADWINLSKTDCAAGSGTPEAGDELVQLGNRNNTDRQSAQILSTVGADAPSYKQYGGISSFSLEGKELTVLSPAGNQIVGLIKFISTSGTETDLSDWVDGATGDIQDAQAAANAAQNAANAAMQAAQDNVTEYNAKFAAIQQQVDGEVNNWFYAYTPTPSNYPASEWTTNEIRDRHIGDTFTNTQAYVSASATPDAGKSWRYVKNASTYSWTPIADSDAVKALLEAATAQSTADGKSTTYLMQPSKYSLGDTWVLGAAWNGFKAGDILTATQSSSTFVAAHWIKRVRYTDDTAANAVNAKIADILNDDIADPSDKQYLKQRWDEINGDGTNGEFFEIINKAISLGVDDNATDAFSDAHYWLGQSLSPLFVNMSINTAIDGSDLRILFKTYYLQKAAIQNAIAEKITENIEVGGDNLIKNGNFILGVQNWNYGSLNPAPTVTILTEADLPNGVVSGIKITVSQTTNGIWQNFADVGNRLELNKEYTLSFIAKHISGSNNRLFYGYEGLGHWVDLTAQWVRYKVTFKPTSYQNFSFYMGVGEFAITNIQLEKGNVVSSWKQYDYIKDALKQSTEINGGLILSSLIGVRDLNNKVRSYISGLVESNPTAFAAGVDFFGDLLNETKTIKLNHDGSGHLAGGDITWDESGNAKIGVLDIQKGTGVVRVIENNVVRYLIHPNLLETLASIRSSSSDNATINLATFSRSAWTENGNYINPNSLILIFENSSIRFTGNVSLTNNPDAAQPLPVGAPKPIDVTSVMIELYKKNSSGSFIHYTTISQDSTAPLANGGIVTNNYSVDRTIYNLPAGEYRIGYSYIIYPEGSVYISAQTFSKNKNIETRRIEFGRDGFMAFYNGAGGENFLHMTESEGLKVGGKTDMPGVLLAGSVAIGGGFGQVWGAKKHASLQPVKNSSGYYTVYHSVGHTDYSVQITPETDSRIAYITHKGADRFTVYFKNLSGALSDSAFSFMTIGRN